MADDPLHEIDCSIKTEFVWSLYVQGNSLREIAEAFQREYNLPTRPSLSTIQQWRDRRNGIITDKIDKMREDYLRVTIDRCEAIIREFMPLLMAETVSIRRWVGQNEVIDEDAFYERAKAAEVIMKCSEQMRRVLGVGLADTSKPQEAGSKDTVTNLILSIIQNNINQGSREFGAAQIIGGEKIIDALDAPFASSIESKTKALTHATTPSQAL